MFRTEIKEFDTNFSISLTDPILSMGSCFANDIGLQLKAHKFQTQINPGGILFNPLSLFEVLDFALDARDYPEASFVRSQSRYLNYKLHSQINAASEDEMMAKTQANNVMAVDYLNKSKLIIFTFGTAWVYRLASNGMLVANCHKVPQSEFTKHLLTVEEITTAFNALKEKIEAIQPDVKFLLTVSPVRHVKDSIPLNSVSKSVLRLACHELSQQSDNVGYFPSYEIMMDDLRDYRFYAKDLIHPNEQAVEYIWNSFAKQLFDKSTYAFVEEWSKVVSALNHKPFHPQSTEHQRFLQATIKKIENLAHQVDVSEEVAFLRAQLTEA